MGCNTLNKFDLHGRDLYDEYSQTVTRVCGHIDRVTLSQSRYSKLEAMRKIDQMSHQLCDYCRVNDTPFKRGY